MKYLPLLLVIAFLSLTSCKKFLDIPFPQNQVSSKTTFSDDSTAKAALNGLYSQLMSTASIFLNGSLTIYPGLSADELFNTSPNVTQEQFYTNALSPEESSQVYNGLWKWAYTNIFHCNSIIEGLNASDKVTAALKTQLKGEALAIRALCYFYLTNLYGDIPLQLTTDYALNNVTAKTNTRDIYNQIVQDLKDAQAALLPSYPSAGRARFNRFATMALLSRVYLYRKEYALAEEASSMIIDQAGFYWLQTDFSKIFTLGSSEAILQLIPVALNQNTGDGFVLNPATNATVRPPFAISINLLNSFEPFDKRKQEWIRSKTVSGEIFYYPFKYRIKSGPPVSEGNVILRLAEQYLIRAESRAMQDNLSGALEDINVIRSRAGLSILDLPTKEEVLEAIIKERRIELMTEMGHRWLDLKRTNRAGEVLSIVKPGWQLTDVLYPIPQRDIDKNPFLKQNAGY